MADGYLILIGKTKKNKLEYHENEKLVHEFLEQIRNRFSFNYSYTNLVMKNEHQLHILNYRGENHFNQNELNKFFKSYEEKGIQAKLIDPENIFKALAQP